MLFANDLRTWLIETKVSCGYLFISVTEVIWALWHLRPLPIWLFNLKHLALTKDHKHVLTPHYVPFLRGFHQWQMDSPHKGPAKWQLFLCHDILIDMSYPCPAWRSYYIHHKVWNETTYPFPNFNGCTVEVWEWISNFIPHSSGHVITDPFQSW